MLTLRRDVAYLPELKGGLGIRSIRDEYWVNRARVVGNIMEAGARMEGRGQEAWARRLLWEEVEDAESDYKLINEIRDMLSKLQLQVQNNTQGTAGTWTEQYQVRQWAEQREKYKKVPYVGGRFVMSLGSAKTVTKVVEIMEKAGVPDSAIAEAITGRDRYRAQVCENMQWDKYAGVVLGQTTMNKLAQASQGPWGEIEVTWEDMEGVQLVSTETLTQATRMTGLMDGLHSSDNSSRLSPAML